MIDFFKDEGSVYTLIQAIVLNAVDDIKAWENFKYNYGYDYPDDPLVPEIPENVHHRIRVKGQRELYLWLQDFNYKKRHFQKDAFDAKEFLLGGWFYMMTGVDGKKLYEKTVTEFWDNLPSKKPQETKKVSHNNCFEKDADGNIVVTYQGKTKPLYIWCELLGLRYRTVYHRIYLGETDPEVFFLSGKDFKRRNKKKE